MSDRYPGAGAGYYEHQQESASATAMSHHYPPQPYRTAGYGYPHHPQHPGYGQGYGYGSYMSSYYRYAPYASPHYSQHHQGMFTPAGQQLIPSSVLHYPPRNQPQPQSQQQLQLHHQSSYQQQQQQQQQQLPTSNHYETPATSLFCASSAPSPSPSPSPYAQSRGFSSYHPPAGRSSTPAPNRTVLPPNYLEPLRNYAEQHHTAQLARSTPKLDESHLAMNINDLPAEAGQETATAASSPPQRLLTSPPLISATGTDSGISNCSTRARSDSSQSTPVYSGEYPVNMSVESASCVSYHCPADGREYEEEQQQQQQLTATASDQSQSSLDKTDVTDVEINLTKPHKETASIAVTETPPQDADKSPTSNLIISEHAETELELEGPTSNWSPSHRRPLTPPVPQNSPVGYGQSTAALTNPLNPLMQLQQQQHFGNTNNNRIIECDLIPSKKSKRKTSKKENSVHEQSENVENSVREQIRDIKPLPGFLQAFGSTEIGRFSERFLQTTENFVEHLAEEYAAFGGGVGGAGPSMGYGGGYGYQYQMPDYMAYERYAGAYATGPGRNRHHYRHGEIRCNGY
ncbi:uncharacterized protein Dwil_GK17375 [Drosophila willistoni]|uniref:Uncharacterized protein n=1 Tax=Drosophila willistoni TaxID=7260 RepID=A0A0Q9WPQ5_DROWI|nr:uncharacterized protein Dwil_GK17375 [Drosophila willistoni]